jgi:hypothetical protein
MTHKIDTNINAGGNAEIYFDDCAEPVQADGIFKTLNSANRRLRIWATAQLKAHENRVIALGVHRRSRVDESQKGDSRA